MCSISQGTVINYPGLTACYSIRLSNRVAVQLGRYWGYSGIIAPINRERRPYQNQNKNTTTKLTKLEKDIDIPPPLSIKLSPVQKSFKYFPLTKLFTKLGVHLLHVCENGFFPQERYEVGPLVYVYSTKFYHCHHQNGLPVSSEFID